MDAFPTDEKSYAQLQVDSHSQRIGIVVDIPQEPKATHIWVYAYKTLQEEKSVSAHKVFYRTIDNRALFPSNILWAENTSKIIHGPDVYAFQIDNQKAFEIDDFNA